MATLATDLAAAFDPAAFSRQAGIEPDPWQSDVLRSTAPRMLLNCSRQSGKSTTAATLGMHGALYVPDTLVLIVSPGERQSGELFRKCLHIYRTLGRPVDPETENKRELELSNGSRIVALPGKEGTIRSFSGVGLLLIDEGSRVMDDTYKAVRPMLAVSGGRLVALSTPWGKRGWWYEAWVSDESWQRVRIPAEQCPRIPAAFLAEERAALGELWYASEYRCEFVENDMQLFRDADIDTALAVDIAPLPRLWQVA